MLLEPPERRSGNQDDQPEGEPGAKTIRMCLPGAKRRLPFEEMQRGFTVRLKASRLDIT